MSTFGLPFGCGGLTKGKQRKSFRRYRTPKTNPHFVRLCLITHGGLSADNRGGGAVMMGVRGGEREAERVGAVLYGGACVWCVIAV